ncbi:hypothetical protein PENFLA_c041G07296 [Penicillium flavigenum]|uniref:Uncharacterized protein n=1 Tax=Penicillium flavigenum TaxID=254877 RepID=A0A1V6SJ62_9EURO|nr:hypothetical protein PENFLA_c041G07296 [Penicillium flavigenum]
MICEYINRSLDEEEEFHFLRFELLQRLNIVKLLLDLVRLKGQFQRDKRASIQDLETLESTLQKYATAIWNHQFLKGKAALEKAETRRRKLLLQCYFQSRVNDQFTPTTALSTTQSKELIHCGGPDAVYALSSCILR